MSASTTAESEQNRPEPTEASQPEAGSSQNAKDSPESTKGQPNLLLDIPRDILNTILLNLAKEDYGSLTRLSGTCRALRHECQEFMKKNPYHSFVKSKYRPAGMSDSEDDDVDSVDWSDQSDDIWDDSLADMIENLSFGSNLDEEALEEWRRDGYRGLDWNDLDEENISDNDEEQLFARLNAPSNLSDMPDLDPIVPDPKLVPDAGAGACANADADADVDEDLW